MSPHIARGLNTLFNGEHRVVALKDHFGRGDLTDREWIERLGKERGWCVLSEDIRITRNPLERSAFLANSLVGFFLARSVRELPIHRKTARILILWDQMESISTSVRGGLFEIPIKSQKLRQIGR